MYVVETLISGQAILGQRDLGYDEAGTQTRAEQKGNASDEARGNIEMKQAGHRKWMQSRT